MGRDARKFLCRYNRISLFWYAVCTGAAIRSSANSEALNRMPP
jgi:hypothetical protein